MIQSSTDVAVRRAQQTDSGALKVIWLEAAEAFVSTDRRFRLAPDAADLWERALLTWLGRPDVGVFVAEANNKVLGYMVAAAADNVPGILPARYIFVSDVAVDMHAKTGGIGRAMLDAVRAWARSGGINHVEARVPARNPVAQAFWRAMGASRTYDQMCIVFSEPAPDQPINE